MALIMYLIVGLIAGWVATELTARGIHHKFFTNITIGTIGALVGGYIFEILALPNFGFWESVGTSMVGALVVLTIVRFF